MMGRAWWQEVKAIEVTSKNREMNAGSWFHFSLFLSLGPQSKECFTHIQGLSHPLVQIPWKHPDRQD